MTIHTYTPRTADVATWLDETFPERDVVIAHTAACEQVSCGDECVGGCEVRDEEVNFAEVMARVTGSRSATYTVERRNADGTLTVESQETWSRS